MNNNLTDKLFSDFLTQNNYPYFDLKALLFDMDGVLYDSMPAHVNAWQQTMDDLKINTTAEEFFMHEGRTGRSTIDTIFRRELNRPATKEEEGNIYARKTVIFSKLNSGKTMPYALALLKLVTSEGLKPVLVTGSGQPSLINKLDANFPHIFTKETMVTSYDVKYGKPNPEPFILGLKRGGDLKPYQAIVVENAPLGVEAGHKAGIFVIAVNTGPLSDEILLNAGANIVFDSVKTLSEQFLHILEIISAINRKQF